MNSRLLFGVSLFVYPVTVLLLATANPRAVASTNKVKVNVTNGIVYPAAGDNLANDMAVGCPIDTTVTCQVVLPAGAVISGYSFPKSATRPNVNIGGAGMGTYASLTNSTGDTILTSNGGSVIQCSMELMEGANNWTIHDLSVDVGDALVSNGTCTEANGIDASPPYSTTQSPPIQDISINNVSILLRNSTSGYHAFKCENTTNCSASNSYALFGTHGFVGKFGSNIQFTNLWSSGHSSDCAIFKSGTTGYAVYANLNGASLDNITCTSAQPGDTQGVLVDAQNGNVSNITLSNLNMQGTIDGVYVDTDSISTLTGLTVNGINFVSAPYANGSSSHFGVLLSGILGTLNIDGLVSSGADSCVNIMVNGTSIANLTIASPQCTNTYGMVFQMAGGGTNVIDSPAIVHTPATSSPKISCNTVNGTLTATSCTTTTGSGLWYSPKISFSGCTTNPSVTFILANNKVTGYSISNAGAGCPATIAGNVKPNWDSYDFYNRGANTSTTVVDATYNELSSESIGYVSGTDGIAPPVVFTTDSATKKK